MKTVGLQNHYRLICQNCDMQYNTIKDFKAHVRGLSHKQEVSALFQKAVHHGQVFVPMFVVLEHIRDPNHDKPIVGLDMVTLCTSPEKVGATYLCHICEENLSSSNIVLHLCSLDHYFKYLAFCNPGLLRFAWLNGSFSYLQSSAMKDSKAKGSGALRILEIPKRMLKQCKRLKYHQVMSLFSKTDKVIERLGAARPQRKSLQSYVTDPARTYPLIGLDLLLEYSCPENKELCGYLCTLCKKNLPAIESIPHCISFDHIFNYLEAAHPDTLDSPRSSYSNYSCKFYNKIQYFASQAEKHNPPGEIQSMHLDHGSFKGIKTSIFANALEKLQQIRQERNLSELKVTVVKGEQIPCYAQFVSSPGMTTTDLTAKQETEMACNDPTTLKSSGKGKPCSILCVECDTEMTIMGQYKKHINGNLHRWKLVKLFGPGSYNGFISKIKLYEYMWARQMDPSSPPLIGLNLLTVFVARRCQDSDPPIYLCHACELSISMSSVSAHLTSTKHYFNTFTYTKPDSLLLKLEDTAQLTEFARQEEAMQQKVVLQVCEIPSDLCMKFRRVGYDKIMATIKNHASGLSKCIDVEKRVSLESYANCCDRKGPLLGVHLMVKYSSAQPYPKSGYLCLLCKVKLSEMQSIAHVLSSAHMHAYLREAHPGSLTEADREQRSLIVDLSQQAEKIGPEGTLQVVEMEFVKFHEVEKASFKNALDILQLVLKQRGHELKDSVVPKNRLVLLNFCDEIPVPSFEKTNSDGRQQESSPVTSNSKQVITDVEFAENHILESIDPTTALLETQKSTSPAYIQPTETQSTTTKQTSLTLMALPVPGPLLRTVQADTVGTNKQPINQAVSHHISSSEIMQISPSNLQPQEFNQTRQQSSDFSPEAGEPAEGGQEFMEPHAFSQNETQAVPQSPQACNELWNYLKKDKREPVIGLKSVIECHTDGQPPFYLCVTCTKRSEEDLIIRHLTSRHHQFMYLKSIDYPPLLGKRKQKSKWLRMQSIEVERIQGYGEAQVLELEPEVYHQILNSPILTALGKLKDILIQLTSDTNKQSEMGASSVEPPRCDPKSSNDPAQSSPHLWSYLTSSTRTEPVIGLSMITEYRSCNGQNSYLCSCCSVIQLTSKYMAHLISPRHRFNYIKHKHPELVAMWEEKIDLTSRISDLRVKAQILQDREGWGCLKVVQREFLKKELAIQIPTKEEDQNKGTHSTEQQNKKKKNKCAPKIGLNFITCVSHEKKKLFFCALCSVRCHVDHMTSTTHRKAYMELKNLKVRNNGKKMSLAAMRLATAERRAGITMKKLNVTAKQFTTLRTAPLSEALSQLATMQGGVEEPNNITSGHTQGNSVEEVQMLHSAPEPSQHEPVQPQQRLVSDSNNIHASHTTLPSYPTPPVDLSSACSPASPPVCTPLPPPADHTSPSTSTSLNTLVRPYSPVSPVPEDLPSSSPLTFNTSELISVFSQPLTTSQCPPSPPPLYIPISPPSSSCQDEPRATPFSPPAPSISLPTQRTSPPLFHYESDLNQTTQAVSSSTFFQFQPSSPTHSSFSLLAKQPLPVADLLDSSSSSSYPHISSLPTTHLTPSTSYHLETANPSEVMYGQSYQRKQCRLQVAAPPNMYSFLNTFSATAQSNVSKFLDVRGLSRTEPIIGLSNVVEFQAISKPTFYLCLNCALKISIVDICNHMASEQHMYSSIKSQYPAIFQQWNVNHSINVRDLAKRLKERERDADAMVIKPSQKQYECLSSADFNRALEILQEMLQLKDSDATRLLPPPGKNWENRARSVHDCVESTRETTTSQSRTSCNSTVSKSPPHEFHNSQASSKALDNLRKSIERHPSDRMESQHLSKPQTSVASESTGESPEPNNENMQRRQSQETTADVLHCLKPIKQEKLDDEAYQGTCCFGPDIPPREDALPTGNSDKHPNHVMEYVRSKRDIEDAVVGLSSVIACQSEGQAPLYLCVSCSSKVTHDLIVSHLQKNGHREKYLKARYPSLFEGWSDAEDMLQKSTKLMSLAHKVETTYEDEPGQIQEMKVECTDLKDIKEMEFDIAIRYVQIIREERNLCALQTFISPKILPVALVKQEKIETEVEVMTKNVPLKAGISKMVPQSSRAAFKRQTDEPDSPTQSPVLAKQLKLTNVMTLSQEMTEQLKPLNGHSSKIACPSTSQSFGKSAKNTTEKVSFKESSRPTSTLLLQKSIYSHTETSVKISCSFESSAIRHSSKCSDSSYKPNTSVATEKTQQNNKQVAKNSAADPRLTARRPSDYHSGRLALNRIPCQSKREKELVKDSPVEKSAAHHIPPKDTRLQTPKATTIQKPPRDKLTHNDEMSGSAKVHTRNQECKTATTTGTNSSKEKPPVTLKSCPVSVTKTDEIPPVRYSAKCSYLKPPSDKNKTVQIGSHVVHEQLHQQPRSDLKSKSNPSQTHKIPLKRQHSEGSALSPSSSKKYSTHYSTGHQKHTVSSQDTTIALESPKKRRRSLDKISQQKKVPSILPTVSSDKSTASNCTPLPTHQSRVFSHETTSAPELVPRTTPNSSGESVPTSQSQVKVSLHQPLYKSINQVQFNIALSNNSEKQVPSSFLKVQQKGPCPNITVSSVEVEGQEIARVPEQRSLVKSSSENAWNYENRQFTTEPLYTVITEQVTALPSQNLPWSGQHHSVYTEGSHLQQCWPEANALDVSAFGRTGTDFEPTGQHCSRPAQVISPVMLSYALPYQYSGLSKPDSVQSGTGIPNYVVAVAETSETSASGGLVNMNYFTEANSSYVAQPVYQLQQTSLPLQSFQTAEQQAYYTLHYYNQSFNPN